AELTGPVDGVVDRVERGLVVDIGLWLQRRVAVPGAVREGPGAYHRQGHRGRVVQRVVDHVVRLLVQVVGVGATEPELLAVELERAVPNGHERPGPALGERGRGGGAGGQA